MEPKMLRLRKRPEFLAVQKGEKRRGALFLLEVRPRAAEEREARRKNAGGSPASLFAGRRKRQVSKAEAENLPRLGLTVTRKTGNAARRNRIKRRLRAACRLSGASPQAATDYVLVARADILTVSFAALCAELRRRFRPRAAGGNGGGKRRGKSAAAGKTPKAK